jgi:carboxyl-terminal processing protease
MLNHQIGDIVILSFGDQTAQEVSEALQYLQAHHARGLILDLRGNPGGYVDAAQQVVSDFLSHGVVAYEESTNKKLTVLPVLTGRSTTRLPIAVLVDAGTASAAEITAGALRDNHRAVLIGTRTYGKGSMQSVYQLADGSSIRITDRMWLTPDKHSIQGTGIRPDFTVPAGTQQVQGGADPQLAAGERYLLHHSVG